MTFILILILISLWLLFDSIGDTLKDIKAILELLRQDNRRGKND